MDDLQLTWPQGEDLQVPLTYQEGADENSLVTVDLSVGYIVRMDIVNGQTKQRIYTFNSDEIADTDPTVSGDQPDTVVEAVLTSGAGGTPNINISVPRSLTLPGGAVYDELAAAPTTVFKFDVFLRNTASDKQFKLAKGTITVEESYTLWL